MYVFVLGTGRCGSSLVHEVLARHPGVGFLSNVEDNLGALNLRGRWNGALFRRLPPSFTRKGRLRYAPSEGYQVLDRRVAPVLSAPLRDLVASDVTPWLDTRTRDFFDRRAAAQRRPVFLHKFTGWPRAGYLRAVFPSARFIHVVRDGRAVANSWLQMPWWTGWKGPDRWSWGPLTPAYRQAWEDSGRSFVTLAGLNWRLLLDSFEAARSRVPDDAWLEVRYEDVLADPRKQLGAMLDFVDLSWSPAFEAGFGRYTFDSARSEAFRRDLDPANLERLETVLATPLQRYGYPLGLRSAGS